MNLVDDVVYFVRGALASPVFPAGPAVVVRGVVLEAACSWRELRVRESETSQARARFACDVVHRACAASSSATTARGTRCSRPRSWPRARASCPCEDILAEYARLQVIVDKTAGPAEREAMAMLVEFVRGEASSARGAGADEHGAHGLRRGAGPAAPGPHRPARATWAAASAASAPPSPRLRCCSRRGPRDELTAEGPESERAAALRAALPRAPRHRRRRRPPAAARDPASLGPGLGDADRARHGAGPRGALRPGRRSGPALARATGRAQRSAVGTWLFEQGGFVLEGGRRSRRWSPRPCCCVVRSPRPGAASWPSPPCRRACRAPPKRKPSARCRRRRRS